MFVAVAVRLGSYSADDAPKSVGVCVGEFDGKTYKVVETKRFTIAGIRWEHHSGFNEEYWNLHWKNAPDEAIALIKQCENTNWDPYLKKWKNSTYLLTLPAIVSFGNLGDFEAVRHNDGVICFDSIVKFVQNTNPELLAKAESLSTKSSFDPMQDAQHMFEMYANITMLATSKNS